MCASDTAIFAPSKGDELLRNLRVAQRLGVDMRALTIDKTCLSLENPEHFIHVWQASLHVDPILAGRLSRCFEPYAGKMMDTTGHMMRLWFAHRTVLNGATYAVTYSTMDDMLELAKHFNYAIADLKII